MHRLSAKQNELNSTDPENNLGVGAVNVWELRISALNAGRFDAYLLIDFFRNNNKSTVIVSILTGR